MSQQQSFKEKVQSMTAKEIIMAMVEGLQNPSIKVDMDTFGSVKGGICFGCAATNTVCKISGKVFDGYNIWDVIDRGILINSNPDFLDSFESAIDALRHGGTTDVYNSYAKDVGFATIEYNSDKLPHLTNSYTTANLQEYINLANAQ